MKLTFAPLAGFALLAGFVVLSCSPEEASETPPRTTPADLVGLYGGDAGIASLELTADGRYEGLVLTGMTMDGCGTFEGAGLSKGTWSLTGGSLAFTPESEPPDLAVRFAEVRATLATEGLVVVVGDDEATLRRQKPYR